MLIIQSDIALIDPRFVTVCPITSSLSGIEMVRVPISASPETGLQHVSEIEVDLVSTIRVEHIARTVGHVSSATMVKVDVALRRWLDL
jgi:mRNA interferase MazF